MKKLTNIKFALVSVFVIVAFSQTNYAQWYTNGSSIVYTNDKVGIGTSSPGQNLEVASYDGYPAPALRLFYDNVGDQVWDIKNNGNLEFNYGIYPSSPSNMVTFSTLGNVGIGTTSPVSKLELGANQWLKFHATSTQSGLLFYETGTHTSNSVQYGAKIYYDQVKDMLKISTMQNNTENVGICVRRTYPRVGIGNFTSDGQIASPLNVRGTANNAQLEIGNSTAYDGNYILSYDRVASAYKNLVIRTTADPTITLLTNGNVGIGCTNPQVKLAVNGTIKASELEITTGPCSDYVFESDYNLMDLNTLEEYLINNKHLPEVPSAKEFSEKGYKVKDMDDILLRKIEELTLYVIDLKKENEELKAKIDKVVK